MFVDLDERRLWTYSNIIDTNMNSQNVFYFEFYLC